jgi:glutamyl-tRNA synthetase
MPDPPTLAAAMPLVKERMKTLTEAPVLLRFLFTDDLEPNEKAAGLIAKAPVGYLGRVATVLEGVEPWTAQALTEALDALAEEEELSRTKAFQPVRAAVTGSNVSPPLPESLELLGRERTLERLRRLA